MPNVPPASKRKGKKKKIQQETREESKRFRQPAEEAMYKALPRKSQSGVDRKSLNKTASTGQKRGKKSNSGMVPGTISNYGLTCSSSHILTKNDRGGVRTRVLKRR